MDEQNNNEVQQNEEPKAAETVESVKAETQENQAPEVQEKEVKTEVKTKSKFKKFLPLIIIAAVVVIALIIFLVIRFSSNRVYVNRVGDLNLEIDTALSFSEGLAPASKDGKWGYINKQGEVVIDFQYDGAMPFSEGRALVLKDDYMGFIDKKGNEVIPCEYDNIGQEGFQNGVARVYNQDGEWGLIDKNGNTVVEFGKYYRIGTISEDGIIAVEGELNDDWTSETGYINTKGEEIVPLSLDNLGLGYPSEGLAIKSTITYEDTSSDYYYGYVNSKQEVVIEQKYKSAGNFSEGLACVSEDGENYGYINKKGELVIDYQFKLGSNFQEGYAVVVNDEDKFGVIDKNGNLVVDYQYDYISPFKEGMAVVVTDMTASENNCGFINTKGEMVIEPIYDAKNNILYGYADFSEGLACVTNGDYTGFVNYKGKAIIGKIAEEE